MEKTKFNSMDSMMESMREILSQYLDYVDFDLLNKNLAELEEVERYLKTISRQEHPALRNLNAELTDTAYRVRVKMRKLRTLIELYKLLYF